MTTATRISGTSRPTLSPHARLRNDATRKSWVLLGPEKVFVLDDIAVAILELCDGQRSISEIAEELAARYSAALSEVTADVTEMLQHLQEKGLIVP